MSIKNCRKPNSTTNKRLKRKYIPSKSTYIPPKLNYKVSSSEKGYGYSGSAYKATHI
jgi:hypothetical protein